MKIKSNKNKTVPKLFWGWYCFYFLHISPIVSCSCLFKDILWWIYLNIFNLLYFISVLKKSQILILFIPLSLSVHNSTVLLIPKLCYFFRNKKHLLGYLDFILESFFIYRVFETNYPIFENLFAIIKIKTYFLIIILSNVFKR